MPSYWYKPKTYGYGAAPTNWKGWAFIAIFALYVFSITAIFIVVPLMQTSELSLVRYSLWALFMVLGVMVFLKITASKTDGTWRWRWGEE